MRQFVLPVSIIILIVLLALDLLLRLSEPQGVIESEYATSPEILEYEGNVADSESNEYTQLVSTPSEELSQRDSAALEDLSFDAEDRTIELFETLSPSVVNITTMAHMRDSFRMRVQEVARGAGSGFIWSSEGYIVTNFHVIKDANAAKVTLTDGSTWDAQLVGAEPDKDLAILKIDAPEELLPGIRVGRSRNLKVGQSVMAIGNPFGLDQTLTTGVISGLGREIESVSRRPISGVIQTDAAINPGNSGGPLLDSSGRVIGINTAIFSPSGAYAGIGFAVPIDIIKRMVPQIIEFGEVRRVGMGVVLMEDHLARRYGISGVIIRNITPDGPAHKASLKPVQVNRRGRLILGDVIVGINQERVNDSNDLYRIMDGRSAGDQVNVNVIRDGRERTVKVVLEIL